MEKPVYMLEFEKPLRELEKQLEQLHQQSIENNMDLSSEVAAIEKKIEATKRDIYSNLTVWQRVQIARHPKRPYALDYINTIFEGFQELHGDRVFSDDAAMVGGTAFLDGKAIMVIGQHKGRETKEKIMRNFGSPNPEGYRKAMRLMRLAERFGLPVVCLIDTQGANPGVGSEERHVAEAIAVNLREMALLRTPSVAVVIGEGGSGGALGIGVTDRVLIFENAYYSVISPEGCAAILWKDRAAAPRAAEALKLGAADLLKLGIVEGVLTEPFGGAHNDPAAAGATLKAALKKNLGELTKLSIDDLLEKRYDRYRNLGEYEESKAHTGSAISVAAAS
ncbi:MAG TPA: acetyl-CoA carboxylase carboxyltransferase subunit alpha [Opitutaceae bacterium]|nr:acetyl-CoA carboxylase carboxyltransferase subunit alpha [Opitutaceae bacterium]